MCLLYFVWGQTQGIKSSSPFSQKCFYQDWESLCLKLLPQFSSHLNDCLFLHDKVEIIGILITISESSSFPLTTWPTVYIWTFIKFAINQMIYYTDHMFHHSITTPTIMFICSLPLLSIDSSSLYIICWV